MDSTFDIENPEILPPEEPEIRYHTTIDTLRFVLMFFACIFLIGFPGAHSDFVVSVCGFAPIAFFIISGHIVLGDEQFRLERIKRTIKRSAIVFAGMTLVYFGINAWFYRKMGISILPALSDKRLWFNFLVLNVWPFDIGDGIWFVQAYLYAYIILYFIVKWKLLRFDWVFFSVLFVITLLSGELAGWFRYYIYGYMYFPPNFLNRALPYILLGEILYRSMDFWAKVPWCVYALGCALGAYLVHLERYLLDMFRLNGYYNHLIGMAVIAVCVCLFVFKKIYFESFFELEEQDFMLWLARWHINSIYYICQPLSVGLALLLVKLDGTLFQLFSNYIGLVTFFLCVLFAYLFAYIENLINARLHPEPDEDEILDEI